MNVFGAENKILVFVEEIEINSRREKHHRYRYVQQFAYRFLLYQKLRGVHFGAICVPKQHNAVKQNDYERVKSEQENSSRVVVLLPFYRFFRLIIH